MTNKFSIDQHIEILLFISGVLLLALKKAWSKMMKVL